MKTCNAVLALWLVAATVDGTKIRGATVVDGKKISATSETGSDHPVDIERKGRSAHPHSEEVAAPKDVQNEVEMVNSRVKKLDNAGDEANFADKLEHIEAELDEQRNAMDHPDKDLSQKIQTERANLCVTQGFAHHESDDCEKFMVNACHFTGGTWSGSAGKRMMIPHVSLHVSATSKMTADACQRFFVESTREAIEGMVVTTGDNSSNASAGKLFGGKKIRGLPAQGFDEFGEGKLVEHKDDDTMTSDWQQEHGAGSGDRDPATICKEFPDNQWCRIHGYHQKKHKTVDVPFGAVGREAHNARSAAVSNKPLDLAFMSFVAVALVRVL